ncbi:MAG: VWA domain-containing protein [Clostridia bacterium]|nr:VWA domain-containing protein [Clostridia bacterium]
MRLLVPLGLLGLLGIAVLIIIYILKPNYQQKLVSSTFVWKLSLKYRKKKIPVSKLRNILIIICQILILTACAAILAQPALVVKEMETAPEVIAIIDCSASMRTESGGDTRFERAVEKTRILSENTFAKNGTVSVILADKTAEFLAEERVTSENKGVLTRELRALVEEDTFACSYTTSDIDGAITLCERIMEENPKAKIYLYTDVSYSYYPDCIEVESVAEDEEWNAAILNAYTVRVDGYYQFYVDVACYHKDRPLLVSFFIKNANPDAEKVSDAGKEVSFSGSVLCERDQTETLVFLPEKQYDSETMLNTESLTYIPLEQEYWITSYESVTVYLNEDDSFDLDDNFEIYDGQRKVIKIQYESVSPNPFFNAVLFNLQSVYADRYDIRITEVKEGMTGKREGFDFYIFEHLVPAEQEMPKDGVCLIVDPNRSSDALGITSFSSPTALQKSESLAAEEDASDLLTSGLNFSNITVTQYTRLKLDPAYEVIASFDSHPIMAARKQGNQQTFVMAFNIHFSNIAVTKEFPILMYNIFEYYFPTTTSANSFEVNEQVILNARGEELLVTRGNYNFPPLTEFPAVLDLDIPGTYALTQIDAFGNTLYDYIYVTIPSSECNIWEQGDALSEPYHKVDEKDYYDDLLLYIAAVLVAVLFIEWWLQSRDTM